MPHDEVGTLHNWTETTLWRELVAAQANYAEGVRATVRLILQDVQTLLAKSGTPPTDFTLHDSEHSFRVAQRMAEVIPEDVLLRLSIYETALLLLSAYLHDIGMSPEQRQVKGHYGYLLTGDAGALTEEEVTDFRRWLDGQDEDVAIPLSEGQPTVESIDRANLLVTHYARSKHVAWGEQWMAEHLRSYRLGPYIGWLDDLKALCRSHAQGYHELKDRKFDPRLVGNDGAVVHRRYLACALRVADILEFDPERTPEVVFQHRAISHGSVIYWHRDVAASRRIEDRKQVTITAEPRNARLHKAIEMMADDIEAELKLVRQLDEDHPFRYASFQPNTPLPHRWDLAGTVRCSIHPHDDAYEYIDGSFRPDTQKLLELLSGIQLYGNELHAIRELLQNAFDAVREQIAYERLLKPDGADDAWEDRLAQNHTVTLALTEEDGRLWLTCTDDGAGMNKHIITNYFLVSGKSQRADVRELERRCEEQGFHVFRSGQFGIGALSYFMLADRVEIRTRRSQDAGDADECGWWFETEGVGSFGELRKDRKWLRGTEVRLRLAQHVVAAFGEYDTYENESPTESKVLFSVEVSNYLMRVLIRRPCRVQLALQFDSPETVKLEPGWSTKARDEISMNLDQATTEDEDSSVLFSLKPSECLF